MGEDVIMNDRIFLMYGTILKYGGVAKDIVKKDVIKVVVGDIDEAYNGYWNARRIMKQYKRNGKIDSKDYYAFVRNLTYAFKKRFGIHHSKMKLDNIGGANNGKNI